MRKVKRQVVPIRLSDKQDSLIREAAERVGENRTEFIRYAAMSRVEEIFKQDTSAPLESED